MDAYISVKTWDGTIFQALRYCCLGTDVSMRLLIGSEVIFQLADVESDQDICARDWERMRAAQIVQGRNQPKSVTAGTG